MKIADELREIGCEIREEFPMSRYTTLRVGGSAEVIAYPVTSHQLVEALNILYTKGIAITVLGAGSNTIVRENGIKGVVISTKKLKGFRINDDCTVSAQCGAMLSAIMYKTIKCGLTGFEFAAGIPGTVGGGIFMNAGANGGEIKDVVDKVWIWENGEESVLSRNDIRFEYRKNDLPPGSIITQALFRLSKGDRVSSEQNIKNYLAHRNSTQPVNQANTGSIFKNPESIPAGKLLEELGFKGLSKGQAMFSPLHANFIVNSGKASASDVITLIEKARSEAENKRGISLETEVEIMGDED